MNNIVLIALGLLVSGISFWGMCSFIKNRLGIEGTIAPLVSSCTIIIVLMCGGMLGILRWAKYALQAAGLVSFVYYNLIKRKKPEWLAVAVTGIFLAICIYRFSGQMYSHIDTVSHWGLVLKHLFRFDAFPGRTANYIFFQSYAPGSACFIYFFGCMRNMPEGFCLAAQYMLLLFAFMPVLAFVRKNRGIGLAFAAIAFVFISTYGITLGSLQVDCLLPLIAVGAIAGVIYHRGQNKKAVLIAALAAAVLVYIKSSGAFFAAILVVLSLVTVGSQAASGLRKKKLAALLIVAASMVFAFVSWNMHVEAAFAGGHETKHAVSVSAYAQNMNAKDAGLIRKICTGMLKHMLSLKPARVIMLGVCAAMLAAALIVICRNKQLKGAWLPRFRNILISCVALFVLWYVMLFFMYLFSMPNDEAERVASISRYEKTIFTYIFGIISIFCAELFFDTELASSKVLRRLQLCALVLTQVFTLAIALIGVNITSKDLLIRPGMTKLYAPMAVLNEKYDICGDAKYLIYTDSKELEYAAAYYLVKYEYMSNDIMMISNGAEVLDIVPEKFYSFRNTFAHESDYAPIDDISAELLEYADQYDYILVLNQDDQFEAELDEFLAVYEGDTPVMYAYDR